MLNYLMEIEKARGFLQAVHLSPQWVKKTSRKAFLLETHHTTHIEGTRLTFEQSKKILEGKSIPNADKEDVKEVKNYKDAFKLVSDHLKSKSKITESIIKKIHKELVKGVRGGSAGLVNTEKYKTTLAMLLPKKLFIYRQDQKKYLL